MFFRKKAIKDLSDSELLTSYRKTASPAIVGELYERYNYLIYGLCLKYLKDPDNARDATVMVFEKAMVDLLRLEVRSFDHWIYVVSKNYCLGLLRAQASRQKKENDYAYFSQQMAEAERDTGFAESREKGLRKLELALEQLNVPQKRCVELFYLEDRSYAEITEITGFSLNEVKSHLQNGKRNLKQILVQGA
jgi:RNA polymerase sigma factor (sigma-70 family)